MADVVIYTTPWCSYCLRAKALLRDKGVEMAEIDVSGDPTAREAMRDRAGGRNTVPQIFIGTRHVGGCDDLFSMEARGELDRLLAA